MSDVRIDRSQTANQDDAASRKLLAEVGQSLVRIETDTGIGTGFFVDKTGYILTADHVIKGATVIEATTASGQRHVLHVKSRDQVGDLAVLKTDKAMSSAPPLSFGDSSRVISGQTLRAAGFAQGALSPVFTRGTTDFVTDTLLVTSKMTDHGMSGGPLFDDDKRFLGVVSGGVNDISAFGKSEAAALLLSKTDNKFQLSYRADNWAGDHLGHLSRYPLLAAVDAGAIGVAGYGLHKAVMSGSWRTGGSMAALSVGLLANDGAAVLNARNNAEVNRYSLAAGADVGFLSGCALMRVNKKVALAVTAVSAVGRLATEFYPTKPQLHVKE